ncbi:MAG: hypothetical protein D6784_05865 [Chloroflexi bacterium]|nr:MAG: hypothetical protein D6784_05865 [Chloroflexota bacterium]
MSSPLPEPVCWLTMINESGLKLSQLKPIIYRWCVAEKRPLAEIFDLSPLDWGAMFGLPDAAVNRLQKLPGRFSAYARRLAEWQEAGLQVIIRTDPRYPSRLSRKLPPIQQPLVLWVQGDAALLDEPSVAVLGSTAGEPASDSWLSNLLQTLAGEEILLASGYSRGLDRSACEMMLSLPEGKAVILLPMGITAFNQTTGRLQPAVQAGRAVLVSPFAPDTAYDEKLAEARNLLLDHLAIALLIPQADPTVVDRTTAAIDRNTPVFLGLTDSLTDSHRTLLEAGAYLLTDPGEVVEMVQQTIIDAALQEQNDTPAPSPAPTASPAPTDTDDDFALRVEDVGLIDSQEALEILSLGGEVPEILRRRLKKSQNE